MFGNKQSKSPEPVRVVPVYTVHSLPQPYEVLCVVYASKVSSASPLNILQQLGRAGSEVPACDAVIGMMITPAFSAGTVNAYGTAIRYL